MRNFWIVPGLKENWRQAFLSKGIWGLQDTSYHRAYWLAIVPNDVILFHVSGKLKQIVGYGIVRCKFYQDVPLWEAERAEGRVKWPLRFEFDVEFLLDESRWKDEGQKAPKETRFNQPLIWVECKVAESILRTLNPNVSPELFTTVSTIPESKEEILSPTHKNIQKWLVEIGKLQSYIAEDEFPMGTQRLDVVWRRLPESVPTYVFEVQVGGDLYHAMGKLKHAHDIWNSRIYLVASADVLGSVNQLLAGTFHELKPIFRFIETEKIQSLHKSKRNIYQLEKDLGIIP